METYSADMVIGWFSKWSDFFVKFGNSIWLLGLIMLSDWLKPLRNNIILCDLIIL
jgi:hypothetical protein